MRGVGELKSYLKKFGYLTTNDNSSNNNHFDKNVEFALKEYQVFHHLRPTGRVDAETIKRMGLPRCGVPDIITPQNHKLKGLVILANYSFFSGSPKWEESKRALTYTFVSSANVLRMYDLTSTTYIIRKNKVMTKFVIILIYFMFSMITFIKTTKVCKINLLVEKRKSNPELDRKSVV